MLPSLALSRHALSALLCCVVLLAGAGPVAAQDVSGTLARVAAAWQRGDAAALTALGANAGISLDVDGRTVGPLAARQAAAVLRRLFEDRESVGARITMSRIVGGEPPRAFGELAWTTRARGTTIPDSARLYIAFVHEDDRWRITEIRLLR